MSTKEAKEPREPKEPKHRVEALRQPQRKDSLTSVLTYLQGGRTLPPRASSTVSSTSTQSAPATLAQGLSRPRRHSHGTDVKKKARKDSTTLRALSNLAGIQEDSGTKTKNAKTPEGNPKTTKSGSSEKLNKTARDAAEMRKKKSQHQLSAGGQENKIPSPPPPMPKSILRVASPDGSRPPPRHVRSHSTSAAIPDHGQLAMAGLSPISPTESVFGSAPPDSGSLSQPTSPIVRPMSPGATVRFAKAIIHRVDVGPGRRFTPVKRRSKSTVTYMAPLDPVSQQIAPKVTLQSPTKLRRHQENQAAMGRYWLRTEEEEAQWRADAERRAAEEAERYRAEPTRPPGTPAPAPDAEESASATEANGPEPPMTSFGERLAAIDKLPPLGSVPLLDKLAAFAKSDADDKLETIEADDTDDSDAESDGGASTAPEDEAEDTGQGKITDDKPVSEKTEPATVPVLAGTGAIGGAVLCSEGETGQPRKGQAWESEMGTEKPVAGDIAAENIAVKPATIPPNTNTNNNTKGASVAAPSSLVTAKPATKTTVAPEEVQSAAPKPQQLKAEMPQAQPKQPPAPATQATTTTQVAKDVPTSSATATSSEVPATPPATPPATLVEPDTPRAGVSAAGAGSPLTPQPLQTTTTVSAGAPPQASTIVAPRATTSIPAVTKQHLVPLSTEKTLAVASVRERPLSPRPLSPRPLSPRPSSPLPTLRHKKSMASMGMVLGGPAGTNHLHLSGRRNRRYSIGDHTQEITA